MGNGLPHHHVERAHPIARDQQQVLGIHLVDFAHLPPAEKGKRQRGSAPTLGHTPTSAASASAASGRARASSGMQVLRQELSTCAPRGRCSVAGSSSALQRGSRNARGTRDRRPAAPADRWAAPAHRVRHRQAVPANHLVERLPVAARRHAEHEPALGRHERHLRRHVAADDVLAHLESRRDVGGEDQDGVRGQERLGEGQPAVGAVVQGALEPLVGCGVRSVGLQRDHEAGERRRSARPASGCACRPSRWTRSAPPRTARAARPRAAGAAGRWPSWRPTGRCR